jgi:hypothetical protein
VGKYANTDIDGDGNLDSIKVWYEEYESSKDVFQPEYYIEINNDRFDITPLFSDAYMGGMSNALYIVNNYRGSKYHPEYKDYIKSTATETYCHVSNYLGDEVNNIPDIAMLIMDIDTADEHRDIIIPVPKVDNYAGDPSEGFDYTAEDMAYVLNYDSGQLSLTKQAIATGITYISAFNKDIASLNEIFKRNGNTIVVKRNEVFGSDGSNKIEYGDFYESNRLNEFTYYDGKVKTQIEKLD